MHALWAILAVLSLTALALAAYLVRVLILVRAWHPGDSLPDVPEDAAIRRGTGD